MNFNDGLTVITGETGAGKSILLGALSLLLGKRADISSVKDASKKCVIEGEFFIEPYQLHAFFEEEALDYEKHTIIRREILPSGKSRAFVNDTPVNLNTLIVLGERLIDIHNQHQTLEVASEAFQFELIDALAGTKDELQQYKSERSRYSALKNKLQQLRQSKADSEKELDYNSFLYNELSNASLKAGEQEELEQEYETLGNAETIQETLSEAAQFLNAEEAGVLNILKEIQLRFGRLKDFSPELNSLWERTQSTMIELDDVSMELEKITGRMEANPERLQNIEARLQQIYLLQKKHQVASVEELLSVQKELEAKIDAVSNTDFHIEQAEKEIAHSITELEKTAALLHKSRNAVLPDLKHQLEEILHRLGLPNAKFQIEIFQTEEFTPNGKDDLQFLFTANKGTSFNELKKAASGGELSRIMLAVKSVLTKYSRLPTIVFDEIDTGVSGEIANKIADILSAMGNTMQVVCITHLPQIAAKGRQHIRVFKQDINEVTTTQLQVLNYDERVLELAQMLSGEKKSEAAVAHAKELLN